MEKDTSAATAPVAKKKVHPFLSLSVKVLLAVL
jgi:hypothetical protein